jgi:hypothetical protein
VIGLRVEEDEDVVLADWPAGGQGCGYTYGYVDILADDSGGR